MSAWPARGRRLDQVAHVRGGDLERLLLLGGERDLEDLLETTCADLHRNPDVEVAQPVLALEERRRRQHGLAIPEIRLRHQQR
jgi:hypothetical protein